MKEHVFVGAYWSARKESRLECARRAAKFLSSISDWPILSRWYFQAYSRKAATKPIEVSVEKIEEYLEEHRDDDRKVMEDLGFSLSGWNGNDEYSASFSIDCGSFSKFVDNSVVIFLPIQEPPANDEEIESFSRLLGKFVEAWDPDVATVSSHEFRDRTGGGPLDKGGWLTYRRGKGIEIKKG